MDHRRAGRDKLIPEIHVDYCFMGSKIDVATKCIVVAKDYTSKSVMASVVPVKGASKLGWTDTALQDLLAEVGRRRTPAKTFYEVSSVGSSASNGGRKRSADC